MRIGYASWGERKKIKKYTEEYDELNSQNKINDDLFLEIEKYIDDNLIKYILQKYKINLDDAKSIVEEKMKILEGQQKQSKFKKKAKIYGVKNQKSETQPKMSTKEIEKQINLLKIFQVKIQQYINNLQNNTNNQVILNLYQSNQNKNNQTDQCDSQNFDLKTFEDYLKTYIDECNRKRIELILNSQTSGISKLFLILLII